MGHIALIAALATISAPGTLDDQRVILLGDKGSTTEQVAAAAKGLGTLGPKGPDGFYRLILAPKTSLAEAKKTLRTRGIDYVFEPRSATVDNKSLKSVSNHITYLKAAYKLRAVPYQLAPGETEESGVDFYLALEHYLKMRVGPDGRMDQDEMEYALEQRAAMPPAVMGGGPGNAPYSIFAQVGPTDLNIPYSTYYGKPPLSGRKSDIAIAPSNTNTMYVASAGGGIWKSTDGGTTWLPKSDRWVYLHTTSVAVHTTNENIVLAGTGDYRGFTAAQTQGVMRSTDGGANWIQVGTAQMKKEIITRIIFNPANPNQVVACGGNSTSPGVNGGQIYRSGDAGSTWSLMRTLNANVDDMELGIDGRLWSVIANGALGVIEVSTDFGVSWNPTAANPCVSNQPALDIATSKHDANTLYLLATGDNKIYKSTTSGGGWGDITGNFPIAASFDPNYNWSQKSYDQWLGCTSDGTQDVLLCGLITIAQSVGGGAVWTDLARSYANPGPNFVHSDQHSYAIKPGSPGVVYFGADGGIFQYNYSASPTTANFTSLNATIKDTQFYHVSLHPTDLSYVMGGTQDNATPASRGNLASWFNAFAGDGGWSGFNPASPGVHFSTAQNGAVFQYATANASSPADISPTDSGNFWPGAFITPVIYAGSGGGQLFLGAKDIRRWTGGHTWVVDKASVTAGVCTTINFSPNDPNAMYVGTNLGEIWMTLNPAVPANWTQISTGPPFGGRPIGAIAVKPGTLAADKTHILVGVQGGGANHLFLCTNTSAGTPVWTNVSGNLPNTPVNAVVYDPYQANKWYVGTDIGCFMTVNGGTTWTNMTYLNLPNVHVNALQVSASKAYIYAGTYGRGIWRIQTTSTTNPFSITGTVRTVANAPFAGVSVALKKWREYQLTYTNSTATPIPDNNTTGITSTIPIALNYPMTGGTLYLNITHPYKGDVEVTLIAPDGQEWRVHDRTGGSADDIIGNFDFNGFASGLWATGTWSLRVRDLAASDIGTLNSWKVIPKFYTYVTQTTTTTNASGTYTFPGLEAGRYYIIPTFAGKTWTPAYRIANVGPSRTLQDFKANQ